MAKRIRLYGIERGREVDAETALDNETFDLADPHDLKRLFVAFGTGYYQEVRAVGEDPDAIKLFRGLMLSGGYRPGPSPAIGRSWLYRDGDLAFPEAEPFVFISQTPDPLLVEQVPPGGVRIGPHEMIWQTSLAPGPMLRSLGDRASQRKLRLFACACARYALGARNGLTDNLLAVGERYGDGTARVEELSWARTVAGVEEPAAVSTEAGRLLAPAIDWEATTQSATDAAGAARAVVSAGASRPLAWQGRTAEAQAAWQGTAAECDRALCGRLLCIFGNPFRTMPVEPSWQIANGESVVELARSIYEERRFTDLVVLADALTAGGCTSTALLSHCRQPGEHVRGCWALDLILGKA